MASPPPSPPFRYRGGVFRDLPEKTGKERHHLLPEDCLRGLGFDPDFGPAILMDHTDHILTRSYGGRRSATRWRLQALKLLREGKWDEALEREIADVERVAPGKYKDAIREARERGKGLWPGKRNEQMELTQAAEVETVELPEEPKAEEESKPEPSGAPQQLELNYPSPASSDVQAKARAWMRGGRATENDAEARAIIEDREVMKAAMRDQGPAEPPTDIDPDKRDMWTAMSEDVGPSGGGTEPSDREAKARAWMRGRRSTQDDPPTPPPPGRDDDDRGIGH